MLARVWYFQPQNKSLHSLILFFFFFTVIIRLRKPVTLSANVYPICLPESSEVNPDSLQGDSATLVGYGPATNNSTKVNELNHRILNKQRCGAIYRVNIIL